MHREQTSEGWCKHEGWVVLLFRWSWPQTFAFLLSALRSVKTEASATVNLFTRLRSSVSSCDCRTQNDAFVCSRCRDHPQEQPILIYPSWPEVHTSPWWSQRQQHNTRHHYRVTQLHRKQMFRVQLSAGRLSHGQKVRHYEFWDGIISSPFIKDAPVSPLLKEATKEA